VGLWDPVPRNFAQKKNPIYLSWQQSCKNCGNFRVVNKKGLMQASYVWLKPPINTVKNSNFTVIIFSLLFIQKMMKPNFVYYVAVNRKCLNTSPVLLPLVPFQDTVDQKTALSGNERHYLEVHILLDGLFSSCQFVSY